MLEDVPRKTPSRSGELALIERIKNRSKSLKIKTLKLGIGDDCAILSPPAGHEILITTDFSLEGRHFRRDWHSPESIGHRILARGLSDLAAMGATPMSAFLSLALPKQVARDSRWMQRFLDGLLSLAATHKTPLAGGDTSESPSDEILADIILLGSAPRGQALRRSGARPGDLLYVTGALGGAAAELDALSHNPGSFRRAKTGDDHPHLFPQPRLSVGQILLKRRLATAAIDLSDGLSTDLAHLCEASGVAAEIDLTNLPAHLLSTRIDEAAQINAVLHGGEDYELLFTARPRTKVPRAIQGVPITRIGRILNAAKSPHRMSIVSDEARYGLKPHGWEHLR